MQLPLSCGILFTRMLVSANCLQPLPRPELCVSDLAHGQSLLSYFGLASADQRRTVQEEEEEDAYHASCDGWEYQKTPGFVKPCHL